MASARLSQAGRRVAATLDGALQRRERPSLDEHASNLSALRAERRRAATKRTRGALLGAAAIAAASADICLVTRPSDMTFSVDSAHGEEGAWVAAVGQGVALRFSDGTLVDVRPEGRTRVVDVSERGASILLERGSLSAHVVHRERSAWTVVAGPFAVHVIGTRFDAAWDPWNEVLSVALSEGRVEVTGACRREPRSVGAGEAVRLSCRDVVTDASDAPRIDAPAPAPTPRAAPAAAPSTTAAPAAPSDAQVSRPRPAASWRDLSQEGDYAGAFDAAEQQGIDAIAAQAGSSELLDLADVARFAKHPEVARRIYASLRARFAGTDRAAAAAFHLGRMSFDASTAEAEQWSSTYLAERPSGAFAPEALGRVMEIQHRAGRLDAARATASRYLDAHPRGAHAALARSILAP
ncbi:FecR domain-containing protein [Sorangium sp. So ce590]|uniref:FecR domain-containing protein n=1 Tax=Sorangium sp. So ce590 TaxID=3133317 RepID=UPI003F5FCF41